LPLWQKLVNEVARHRRFADAKWALPTAVIAKLEKAPRAIEPGVRKCGIQALFNAQKFDLYESEDYEADEKRIAAQREKALWEVRAKIGLSGLLEFARAVTHPTEVGTALGAMGDLEAGPVRVRAPSRRRSLRPLLGAVFAFLVHGGLPARS